MAMGLLLLRGSAVACCWLQQCIPVLCSEEMDSQSSGFWMYLSYQLGVRSNSYLTTDVLLHACMEDFGFPLASNSLLSEAGCQAGELVYAVTCCPVFMR